MFKKRLSVFLLVIAYAVLMAHNLIPHEHHHHYGDPEEIHHHHDEHSGTEDHNPSHQIHADLIFATANRILNNELAPAFLSILASQLVFLHDIKAEFFNIDSLPSPPYILLFQDYCFSITGLRAPPCR